MGLSTLTIPSPMKREMLLGWRKFVEAVDPDILTGYNTINFDTWYVLTRAQKQGLRDFPYLGRIKAQVITHVVFQRTTTTTTTTNLLFCGLVNDSALQ